MWRPADPEVVNKIVCEMKHKFIRHTNKIFAPDKAFLRMKEEQSIPRFTPILYTVPPKNKVSIHVSAIKKRKCIEEINSFSTRVISGG